jgi:hypothetical protein
MKKLPLALVVGLLTLLVVRCIQLNGLLPEMVCGHFGANGQGDSSSTRESFLWSYGIISFASIGVFLIVPGLLPRLDPKWINLPHRHYWLAKERKAATVESLTGSLLWFACATALFLIGVLECIVMAHRVNPPVLPMAPFNWMMGAYLVFTLVWCVRLILKYRIKTDGEQRAA